MNETGVIVKWVADKGFGFIRMDRGGKEVFAHITEFEKGAVPTIGDRVSFTLERDKIKKRERAIHVHKQAP